MKLLLRSVIAELTPKDRHVEFRIAPLPAARGGRTKGSVTPGARLRTVLRSAAVTASGSRAVIAVAIFLLVPQPLGAQPAGQNEDTRQELLLRERREKQERLAAETLSTWERWLLALEEMNFPQNVFVKGFHGFRPVVGGMPSGSGLVGGGGYVRGLDSNVLLFTANARVSTRRYTAVDAQATFPTRRSRLPVQAYVRAGYRDLTALNFFGLGPGAREADRTTFELEDRTIGAGLTVTPHRLVELDGAVDLLNLDIRSGERKRSLETVFDPIQTPGFAAQPDFLLYRGAATLDLRDRGIDPRAGVVLRFEATRYDDRDFEAFDFTRVAGEVQAHVPLGFRNRMLAARLRTSHATPDAGHSVPFYLMETLGGAQTLRGFRDYRYRDRRNLVINAEYRWEVWNYVDFALFADAGKVFRDEDDLDLSDLELGYGFGIRGHAPGGMLFRIDVARSYEGFQVGGPVRRQETAHPQATRQHARPGTAPARWAHPRDGEQVHRWHAAWALPVLRGAQRRPERRHPA
jgi:hypothetical protein